MIYSRLERSSPSPPPKEVDHPPIGKALKKKPPKAKPKRG